MSGQMQMWTEDEVSWSKAQTGTSRTPMDNDHTGQERQRNTQCYIMYNVDFLCTVKTLIRTHFQTRPLETYAIMVSSSSKHSQS